MTIGERIQKLRGTVAREKYAPELGVSKNTLVNYEKDVNFPPADVLQRILSIHPDISPEWLLTGDGPMKRTKVAPEWWFNEQRCAVKEPHAEYRKTHKELQAGDEYLYLPLYDVRAAAGGGAIAETEDVLDVLAFKAAWIRSELRLNPSSLYLIYVEGESMEPTLRPGDLILVDHAAPIRDGIFVIRIEDSLLVKRLQRLPGNQVKITSDNPAYDAYTIDLNGDTDGIQIIGRVVWSGRRM